MRKPKNFKDFVLGLLLICVLIGIAYGIGSLFEADPEPGDITVWSGDAEITALQTVTAEKKRNKDTIEGQKFDVEEDAERFPAVHLDGSIILDASQDPYGSMYYTIYKEDFSELYYRSEFFQYPEESGTYYIIVETTWGGASHSFSTQHGFTLTME